MPTFVEVTEKKLVGGGAFCPPHPEQSQTFCFSEAFEDDFKYILHIQLKEIFLKFWLDMKVSKGNNLLFNLVYEYIAEQEI